MKIFKRLSFQNHLLVLALASGLPALLFLSVFALIGDYAAPLVVIVLATAGLCWAGFALAARAFAVYHMQTLSNLLEALREEDYSLRGRRTRRDDALGEVVREVNTLSQTLRARRLEAKEASVLLSRVVTAIDIAVFAFDSRRRLRLVNPAGERLLRRSVPDLLGSGADVLGLAGLLEGEPRRTLQHRFPGGSGRWEVRHGVFRESGVPHYLLVITDLSRALREEERRAWQRLIRVIGHELNNSLAPIRSMADTLRDLVAREPLPGDWRDDVRGGLSVIAERAEALARFMTAYAMLARLPAPERAAIRLKPLAERVAALESRLKVDVEGEDITLQADADQVEQLLINLVKNAAEAAAETQGRVQVHWHKEPDGVRLEVRDEGPGLANTDNLFVPFFSTKPGGTGVGLVLCQQITEAHGGVLGLENRRDTRGCVASVFLPQ